MVDIFSKKWFLKKDRNPTPPSGLYNWYGWAKDLDTATPLKTSLTVNSSNPNLVIKNNYNGTKKNIGIETEEISYVNAGVPQWVTINGSAENIYFDNIIFDGEKYIGIKHLDTNETIDYLYTSVDMVNWNTVSIPSGRWAIRYSPTYGIIIYSSSNPTILYSDKNLNSWTEITPPEKSSLFCEINGKLIMFSDTILSSGTGYIHNPKTDTWDSFSAYDSNKGTYYGVSKNKSSTTSVSTTTFSYSLNYVISNNDVVVAIIREQTYRKTSSTSTTSYRYIITYSNDGINWNQSLELSVRDPFCFASASNFGFIIDVNGSIYTSFDGINWTKATIHSSYNSNAYTKIQASENNFIVYNYNFNSLLYCYVFENNIWNEYIINDINYLSDNRTCVALTSNNNPKLFYYNQICEFQTGSGWIDKNNNGFSLSQAGLSITSGEPQVNDKITLTYNTEPLIPINIYTQTNNPVANNDWAFSTPNVINSRISNTYHDTTLISATPSVSIINFTTTKPKALDVVGESTDRLTFHREPETRYWKSFDMPNFTSNNTWGTLSNSENSSNAYYIFDNKSSGGNRYHRYTSGGRIPIDWYWTLNEDLILTKIFYWGQTYSNTSYATNSLTVYGWDYSINDWKQLGYQANSWESDYNNYTVNLTQLITNKFKFTVVFKNIDDYFPSTLTELIPYGYQRADLSEKPSSYDYTTVETGEWWVDQKQNRVKLTSDYGITINNQSQISAGDYIDLKYNTINKIVVDGYEYERNPNSDNNQLITDFYFTAKPNRGIVKYWKDTSEVKAWVQPTITNNGTWGVTNMSCTAGAGNAWTWFIGSAHEGAGPASLQAYVKWYTTDPICIKKVTMNLSPHVWGTDVYLRGSNDDVNWVNLSEPGQLSNSTIDIPDNNLYFQYYYLYEGRTNYSSMGTYFHINDIAITANYIAESIIPGTPDDYDYITYEENPSGTPTFYLPIINKNYINPITVDWGDGTIQEYLDKTYLVHEYPDTNNYQIKISSTYGKMPLLDGSNNASVEYGNIGYCLQSIDSAYLTMYHGNSLFAGSPNIYSFTNNGVNLNSITTTIYKNNRQLIGSFISDYGLYRAFYNCTSLKSYNFDKVNSIGKYGLFETFYNCDSLTEIIFKDVENIDEYGLQRCFANCSNLKQIYFYNLTQSSFGSYTNQFNEMLSGVSNCTVHFPQNIKSTIENWYDVKNYFGGTDITILYDLQSTSNIEPTPIINILYAWTDEEGDALDSGLFDSNTVYTKSENLSVGDVLYKANGDLISGWYISIEFGNSFTVQNDNVSWGPLISFDKDSSKNIIL